MNRLEYAISKYLKNEPLTQEEEDLLMVWFSFNLEYRRRIEFIRRARNRQVGDDSSWLRGYLAYHEQMEKRQQLSQERIEELVRRAMNGSLPGAAGDFAGRRDRRAARGLRGRADRGADVRRQVGGPHEEAGERWRVS